MVDPKTIKIVVTPKKVHGIEPSLCVYQIDLESKDSSWRESAATSGELQAFERGLKAAFGMIGYHLPDSQIRRVEGAPV